MRRRIHFDPGRLGFALRGVEPGSSEYISKSAKVLHLHFAAKTGERGVKPRSRWLGQGREKFADFIVNFRGGIDGASDFGPEEFPIALAETVNPNAQRSFAHSAFLGDVS